MTSEKLSKIIEDNEIKLSKKSRYILETVFSMAENDVIDKITNMLINKRDNLPEFIEGPSGKKSTGDQYRILDEIISTIQLEKKI